MSSLNRVCLLGNLGRDPEGKNLQNGSRVVNLSIATSDKWRDKNTGETKEKTEWHRIVIWNENIGKIAEQYLRKGNKVYLEGKLQTRKWQDQGGNDRYSTEVVLQGYDGKIVLIDRNDGGQRDSGYGQQERGAGGSGRSLSEDLDDEIPF